jgi:hypothetical protein
MLSCIFEGGHNSDDLFAIHWILFQKINFYPVTPLPQGLLPAIFILPLGALGTPTSARFTPSVTCMRAVTFDAHLIYFFKPGGSFAFLVSTTPVNTSIFLLLSSPQHPNFCVLHACLVLSLLLSTLAIPTGTCMPSLRTTADLYSSCFAT